MYICTQITTTKKIEIMKTTVNHFKISNNCKNRILEIQELKKQIGQTIEPNEFLRKNTMNQVKSEMKQVFGKVLNEIPKAFIHEDCIWKASVNNFRSNGRLYESFRFIPVYNLKN